MRENAKYSNESIFQNEIVPLFNLGRTDFESTCDEETYWDLYERKVTEISDEIYHAFSYLSCAHEDVIFMMHDIFFEFIKQLYINYIVNAKPYSWRALIFNICGYYKFYLSYGEAELGNQDYIIGVTEEENVDIEEPTAARFGVYDQKDLENRNADLFYIDKSFDESRMYFIYYKFFQ